MTAPVFTVKVDATAAEAAQLAARQHLHHIPVADDHGRLAGMVCLCDLLSALDRSDDAIRSEVLYIAVCRDPTGLPGADLRSTCTPVPCWTHRGAVASSRWTCFGRGVRPR